MKSPIRLVAKKSIGGTIEQTIPTLGVTYISPTPQVANLPAIQQLEATRQAAEARLAEERAKRMPNEEEVSTFFEKVKGLNVDVKALADAYQAARTGFYSKIQEDENWVFTPEGKQYLRQMRNILSYDRLNELVP